MHPCLDLFYRGKGGGEVGFIDELSRLQLACESGFLLFENSKILLALLFRTLHITIVASERFDQLRELRLEAVQLLLAPIEFRFRLMFVLVGIPFRQNPFSLSRGGGQGCVACCKSRRN